MPRNCAPPLAPAMPRMRPAVVGTARGLFCEGAAALCAGSVALCVGTAAVGVGTAVLWALVVAFCAIVLIGCAKKRSAATARVDFAAVLQCELKKEAGGNTHSPFRTER